MLLTLFGILNLLFNEQDKLNIYHNKNNGDAIINQIEKIKSYRHFPFKKRHVINPPKGFNEKRENEIGHLLKNYTFTKQSDEVFYEVVEYFLSIDQNTYTNNIIDHIFNQENIPIHYYTNVLHSGELNAGNFDRVEMVQKLLKSPAFKSSNFLEQKYIKHTISEWYFYFAEHMYYENYSDPDQ